MGIIMRGDKPFGSVSKPINVDNKEVPRGNGSDWVESSKVFIKDVETTEGSVANPINLIEKVIETNFPARQDSFNAATIIKGVTAGTDTYEMTLRDAATVKFSGTSKTAVEEMGFFQVKGMGFLQNDCGFLQASLSPTESSSLSDSLNARKFHSNEFNWSNGWQNNAIVSTIYGPIVRFAHNSTLLVEQGAALKFAGGTHLVSDGQIDLLLHGTPGDIRAKGTKGYYATGVVINPYAVIRADGGTNSSSGNAALGCFLNLSNTKFQFIGCSKISNAVTLDGQESGDDLWSNRYGAISDFQVSIANNSPNNLWPPNGTQIPYNPSIINDVINALSFGPLVEIEGPTNVNIGGYKNNSGPSVVDIDISGEGGSSILFDTHIGSAALLNCHLGGNDNSKTILDITPNTASSLRIKAGGQEGSVLNYEFLGGEDSKVWYQIDTEDEGRVQYLITGNSDLFHQEDGDTHFELRDSSTIIMTPHFSSTFDGLKYHLHKRWLFPIEPTNSPAFQLLGSSFIYMREPVENSGIVFNFQRSIDTSDATSSYADEQAFITANFTTLKEQLGTVAYPYCNGVIQETTDFDLTNLTIQDFLDSTVNFQFSFHTRTSGNNYYTYEFKAVCQGQKIYVPSRTNKPTLEIVDGSELRLHGDSKIKMETDSNGDSIITFSDTNDSVTFTIAQLKALKTLI